MSQKSDQYVLTQGLNKVDSFGELNDRKGGGLMILYEGNRQKPVKHPDFMHVTAGMLGQTMELILFCMSVNDDERNRAVKKLTEEELTVEENKTIDKVGRSEWACGFSGRTTIR